LVTLFFHYLENQFECLYYVYYAFGVITTILMIRRGYIILTSEFNKVPSTYSGILYAIVSLSVKGSIIGFAMVLMASFFALTFTSFSIGIGVFGLFAIVLLPQLLTSSIVLIEISSFWVSNLR